MTPARPFRSPSPPGHGHRWGSTPASALREHEVTLEALRKEADPRARWRGAFGVERLLRIEIGVGNSDFLVQVALLAPGFSYLGFEYSLKRVAKFHRRIVEQGAANVRILRANATRVLEELVPPGMVDRVFINFPDPWPKRRHTKNRLVQPRTVDLFVRLLAPGGGISLRTDSPSYAAQMLEVLDAAPALENLAGAGTFAVAPREAIPTAYEVRYRGEGRAIRYLEYRKRSGT